MRLRRLCWVIVALAWGGACTGRAKPTIFAEPSATATALSALPLSPVAPESPPTPAGAAASRIVHEVVDDVPPPGPKWERAELRPAFGYISFFFGSAKTAHDNGSLRPLAAWKRGERGAIRAFRRVDPATGDPVTVVPPDDPAPDAKLLPGGARWYDLPSDGVQFFWLTSGSIVLEAEDHLSAGSSLGAVFRPWAVRVAATLAVPRSGAALPLRSSPQ